MNAWTRLTVATVTEKTAHPGFLRQGPLQLLSLSTHCLFGPKPLLPWAQPMTGPHLQDPGLLQRAPVAPGLPRAQPHRSQTCSAVQGPSWPSPPSSLSPSINTTVGGSPCLPLLPPRSTPQRPVVSWQSLCPACCSHATRKIRAAQQVRLHVSTPDSMG